MEVSIGEVIAFVIVGGFLVLTTGDFLREVRHSAKQDRVRERREEHARDRALRYGDAHFELRAQWVEVIQREGAECTERVCVRRSRRIPPGTPSQKWDLAHDHVDGRPGAYLGPAHRECNQAEALMRGATWPGAPRLVDLIEDSGPPDSWSPDEPAGV